MKTKILLASLCMLLILPSTASSQEENILVDEYIISQEFIDAEVVRIKRQARKLIVRGKNQGKVREFYVPEGTEITIRGKLAKFKDIRRGDTILISMTPQVDEVIISLVRIPETPITLAERQANPVVETLPASLPKTASFMPAILVVGVLFMLGAMGLRFRIPK